MQEDKSIIKVDARILKSISISFFYADNSCLTTTLSEQDVVKITYIDKTKLVEAQGRINSINPIYNNCMNSSTYDNVNSYNIELDCSRVNQSDIRHIQVVNIRSIEFVKEETPEDTENDGVIEDDSDIIEKVKKAKWDYSRDYSK